MVVLMDFLKVAAHWLLSFYIAARKLKTYTFLYKTHPRSTHLFPPLTKYTNKPPPHTFISDFHGSLLRPIPSHTFPYFMLVAFEGGSLIRALLLLLSSPVLFAFGYHSELSLKLMIFITFCGLKTKDMDLVGRAVLPKFYLERLNLQAYEVMASASRRVVFSSLPRVMFEGFVREYLGVGEVVGAELQVVRGGRYFNGLTVEPALEMRQKGLKRLFGEMKADVGLVSSCNPHDHLIISYCKEAYIVNKELTNNPASKMPRNRYPKPLIFHDGRLAFLPTPLSTLSLFLFLPLSLPLSIARIAFGVLPPYKIIFPIAALLGTRFRVENQNSNPNPSPNPPRENKTNALYVCIHKTLLDPVMLGIALQRPVPAVTYSVSPFSEVIAPMKTVRLTRNRETDYTIISQLLKQGDMTICPEGTTCREPYLLRFSPLFAEMSDEIVPVGLEAKVSWFYGTTTSGLKCLDPVLFFMNPTPGYRVRILDRVPREMTCAGGQSGSDVANWVQRQLGEAMGYECTGLTRRDKYMMLAGNEGVVRKK